MAGGRIVVDDARMDAAAAKISSVQAGLQGLQGRLNGSLSAGAPPAVKGQVDAAVAEARATVAGVAGRCSARARELRRRAIFARIADGDIRAIDLRQLRAWNAENPFVNARMGNGKVDDGGLDLGSIGDQLGDIGSGALGFLGRNAAEIGHSTLDLAGLIPLLGEPADGLNGLIYTAEGDEVNAALSYAGMIPIVGWGATGAKVGNKVRKGLEASEAANKATKEAAARAAARRAENLGRWGEYISPDRMHHILGGERKRRGRGWTGGHAHPGLPGQTPFPSDWSEERILDAVTDIASDPHKVPILTQPDGRKVYEQVRHGVKVRVIMTPEGKVWTAFPPELTRNPR